MTDSPDSPDSAEIEADDTEAAETDAARSPRLTTPRVGLQSMLSRDSDVTLRPGFRNPANNRAKAQKKGTGKKSRKR